MYACSVCVMHVICVYMYTYMHSWMTPYMHTYVHPHVQYMFACMCICKRTNTAAKCKILMNFSKNVIGI